MEQKETSMIAQHIHGTTKKQAWYTTHITTQHGTKKQVWYNSNIAQHIHGTTKKQAWYNSNIA